MPIEKFTSESPAAYAPRAATPGEKGRPEPFEDDAGARSGPSPVVPVLACLLTLGAIVGGVYVLYQSLAGAPETAAATETPDPDPPNIDKLISVIGGARSARPDLPNPFVRPGGEGDKSAPTSQPPTHPVTVPSDPSDDASLTNEQAAAALTLEGHVVAGDKACAINGREYRQGDRVGRFVIGHILQDGVVLQNGDFATLLRPKRQKAE